MHLYELIDVPIGHFSRVSGMTLGNALIASRPQNHRSISLGQHVYNLVEEIPATCFASDGTNDCYNTGMTAGYHSDGNCTTNGSCIDDTSETDRVYKLFIGGQKYLSMEFLRKILFIARRSNHIKISRNRLLSVDLMNL